MNARRILVLRRENIGDLVCTTPLLAALRAAMPDAYIALLANSYNAPVVERNPHLDAIHIYTKAKHAGNFARIVRAYCQRAALLFRLRRAKFDDVVLPDPTYVDRNIRLAKFILGGRAKTRVIGFTDFDGRSDGLDVSFRHSRGEAIHIVDLIFRLAQAWSIKTLPPPCVVVPPNVAGAVALDKRAGRAQPVAIHISARKTSQRWSAEKFALVIRQIHAHFGCTFRLFWSPGDEENILHPGDDLKAQAVIRLLGDIPVEPHPTNTLEELIAGLSACGSVICADGGAMHVAAGLGKPIVCLFGESDAVRWHPWGVPYRLLQKSSRQVLDIEVEEVFSAFAALQNEK
jgi:ADP-heptose:LPS heptosyltransferase